MPNHESRRSNPCAARRLLVVASPPHDEVHLLRLADGADAPVEPGAHARFMDMGLVYADGSRVQLVPYAALPLH